jgi:hypothetical protein
MQHVSLSSHTAESPSMRIRRELGWPYTSKLRELVVAAQY